MKRCLSVRSSALSLFTLVLLSAAPSLQACAVCWGSVNSKVTDAMGFAILFLLGLLLLVLAGIASIFIILARRARQFPVPTDEAALNH